jgi:hypothetical protein
MYWVDDSGTIKGTFSCTGNFGGCPPENSTDASYAVRQPVDGRAGNGWTGYSMLHEVVHALDAVDPNSPHGTAEGHCGDGYHPAHGESLNHEHHDVMCYNDLSSDFVATQTCLNDQPWLVDCNKDDYWKPGAGTPQYLASNTGALTVFNAARSIWLSSVCSEATAQEPLSCQLSDGRTN